MAYLALARKWRPKMFSEVVGQTHVVQALSNALDSGRVHHAFLFTGTRGVGKTTLARIFAKSLNCEEGVSAEPCQKCNTCIAIDEGRFVDLIEVDAASRTKVDDTRELLENVQYAPTSGKYKVYLIDEVHMLSGHSFNALLKTLEEPPEHVKFLFATTDPQKLPITVLSRCLQFSLRAMRPEQVYNQLTKILSLEAIESDPAALQLLAKAADGSMRDGLSLLDQAIAQSAGEVRLSAVQTMLGTIKTEHTEQIISALIEHNTDQILAVIGDMADQAVDFVLALDELLMQLYYISLTQTAPQALTVLAANDSRINSEFINQLASAISSEQIQLYYQMGLISKRDITLAPSLRVGFEMALLRMLVFQPTEGGGTQEIQAVDQGGNITSTEPNNAVAPVANQIASDNKPSGMVQESPLAYQAATPTVQQGAVQTESVSRQEAVQVDNAQAPTQVNHPAEQQQSVSAIAVTLAGNNEWGEIVEQTNMVGLSKEMAMNCACEKITDELINLTIAPKVKHLFKSSRVDELQQALRDFMNSKVTVQVEIEESDKETPSECLQRLGFEQLEQTKQGLADDPNVKTLMTEFGARINESSVKPI